MEQVCFSHGKESGPWGSKITALADVARGRGYAVESLDYRGIDDPLARAALLEAHCAALAAPPVLVGSSMGAYVALAAAAASDAVALFLMAPAVYVPGYDEYLPQKPRCPITIVHGWGDDIIPPESAIRFAGECKATLHILDDDHRLSANLPEVCRLFAGFLEGLERRA
jgi:pimeloyl-ACP methyl ester carboxylesterase